MKKTILFIFVILLVMLSSSAFIFKSSNGIAGQTGSPGEGNCGTCHSGGSSSASGVTISATPSFTNNEYIQGQTYTMAITVAAVGFNNYGFGCEILRSNNTNAGTMQNAGVGVKFLTSGTRKNAVHTTPKNGLGSATFNFEWVAPLSSETIKVFVGGNCVNLSGNTSGDLTLTSSLTLTTPVMAGINESIISVSGFNVFPNPASESINFSYNLNKESQVLIELVSFNGQIIHVITNEHQASGLQKRQLTVPNHITDGVYFIRLSVNGVMLGQRLLSID